MTDDEYVKAQNAVSDNVRIRAVGDDALTVLATLRAMCLITDKQLREKMEYVESDRLRELQQFGDSLQEEISRSVSIALPKFYLVREP